MLLPPTVACLLLLPLAAATLEDVGTPPPPAPRTVPLPTSVQTSWQDREVGGLITWGMNIPLANSAAKPTAKNHYLTTGVSMCSGCGWELQSLPPVRAPRRAAGAPVPPTTMQPCSFHHVGNSVGRSFK